MAGTPRRETKGDEITKLSDKNVYMTKPSNGHLATTRGIGRRTLFSYLTRVKRRALTISAHEP